MRFTCKICDTKYSVPDKKLRDKILKIRCKRCRNPITVHGPKSPPAVASKKTLHNTDWHVAINGKQEGPCTKSEIENHIKAGRINKNSYIWCELFTEWKKLNQVDLFKKLFESPKIHPKHNKTAPKPQTKSKRKDTHPFEDLDNLDTKVVNKKEKSATPGIHKPIIKKRPIPRKEEEPTKISFSKPDFDEDTQISVPPSLARKPKTRPKAHQKTLKPTGPPSIPPVALRKKPQKSQRPHSPSLASLKKGRITSSHPKIPKTPPPPIKPPKKETPSLLSLRFDLPPEQAPKRVKNTNIPKPASLQPPTTPFKPLPPAPLKAPQQSHSFNFPQEPPSNFGSNSLFGLTEPEPLPFDLLEPPDPSPSPEADETSGLIDIKTFAKQHSVDNPAPKPSTPELLLDTPQLTPKKKSNKLFAITLIGLLVCITLIILGFLDYISPNSYLFNKRTSVASKDKKDDLTSDSIGTKTNTKEPQKLALKSTTDPPIKIKNTSEVPLSQLPDSKNIPGPAPEASENKTKSIPPPVEQTEPSEKLQSTNNTPFSEKEIKHGAESTTTSVTNKTELTKTAKSTTHTRKTKAVRSKKNRKRTPKKTTNKISKKQNTPKETVDPNLPKSLDKREVQKIIKGRFPEVRACYDKKSVDKSGGTIKIKFMIDRRGRVSTAKVTSSKFKGTEVGRCIVGVVKSMKFKAYSGDIITINYPFILQ